MNSALNLAQMITTFHEHHKKTLSTIVENPKLDAALAPHFKDSQKRHKTLLRHLCIQAERDGFVIASIRDVMEATEFKQPCATSILNILCKRDLLFRFHTNIVAARLTKKYCFVPNWDLIGYAPETLPLSKISKVREIEFKTIAERTCALKLVYARKSD